MSFGGQTPTIIVLKEGTLRMSFLAINNTLTRMIKYRHGLVARKRADHIEYQRLSSCSGNDTKYTRSLWRRFVTCGCKRQANDHERWRDCYEGRAIFVSLPESKADLIKLLDIVHPAARILTDIARSQDAEVGDGTTSVVVLAGEILKEVKDHVEQGVSSQTIIKGLRRASTMAVNKVKEIAVNTSEGNKRETLSKLAGTAMSSKLIKRNTGFFTKSMF